ncbi:MAG: hypothetical protein JSW40_05145, partial [Candidatus Omnitrophota bacterium]
GFFENVTIDKKHEPEGVVIIFNVTEKPLLKKLEIEGARFIRKKNIQNVIGIEEGSFVDEYRLREATNKIKDLYTKKGFTQAEVDYDIEVSGENEAEIKFVIDE